MEISHSACPIADQALHPDAVQITGHKAALFTPRVPEVQLHTWKRSRADKARPRWSFQQEHQQRSRRAVLFSSLCWMLLPLEQTYQNETKAVYSEPTDLTSKRTEVGPSLQAGEGLGITTFGQAAETP